MFPLRFRAGSPSRPKVGPMQGQVTTDQINELLRDGGNVLTTVLDFGNATIKRSTKADLSLLTISGVYSSVLGKEIEKVALQCRGNVGIEFKDIKVNPSLGRKFDGSILGVLRTIRDRHRKRNRLMMLCMPPSELVDFLKLTGVYDSYHIVERAGSPEQDHGLISSPKSEGRKQTVASHHQEKIEKKILHLNQSLKRTVSLEKGLDSAEKCVKRFLPQHPPEAQGYSFAFSYNSSEKVGGDFFDFIPLGEEHLGVSIGDVSGHGIDAALLMGISKKVIHIRALDAGATASPRDVLRQANADLVTDFTRSTFVTVLYGILHLPTGTFFYARAGHEPPFVSGPNRGQVVVHDTKGLPLGVDSGKIFDRVLEEHTVQVPRGAFVFLCTDGLAECWNTRGATFSRKRLVFSLEQLDEHTSCQDGLDGLLKAIASFAEGRPQEDDMTTILFKRH